MIQPTRAEIRKFLTEHFNDNELENFCFDYFPPVENEFTAGMTKSKKIRTLISYTESRGRDEDLFAALKRERGKLYFQTFEPQSNSKALKDISRPQQKFERKKKQIFLSHSSRDSDFAQMLAKKLRDKGWEVWIAPESILPGEKWAEAINRGLEESVVFLLLISPNSVASRWVTLESNAAINLDTRNQIRFVPLELEPTDAPVLWSAFQWIPFRKLNKKNLDQLQIVLSRENATAKIELNGSESAGKGEKDGLESGKPLANQMIASDFSLPMMFIAAEKAYEIGDVKEAERVFQQVCDLDQGGIWAENAQNELEKSLGRHSH